MKNIYTVLLVLFVGVNAFGQRQRADRFFAVGDYVNAAKYYETAYEKENSKENLTLLIDSYYKAQDYYNASRALTFLKAERYNDADKSYDNKYNFMMYQVVNVTQDSEGALNYLATYYANKGEAFNLDAAKKEITTLKKQNPKFTTNKSNISSEADDFGAIKVGDSIFFVSDRMDNSAFKTLFAKRFKTTGRPFLDIYGVRVNEKNEFIDVPASLGQGVNTKLHEGNFTYNAAGDEMYLSRSAFADGDSDRVFDEEGTNRIHLYKSVRIDGVWKEAERLPFVKDGFSYMHPTLTKDGKRLYFSSDMDGGLGSFDIYYVTVQLDGSYGVPVNLGAIVNSAQRDQFPFVSENGDLYFATDGRIGLGLLDIFVAPLTVKGFTAPINLGAPINSKYDDFSLSYYSVSDGLFATNRNGTDDDIYSFVQTDKVITRQFKNTIEVRDVETNELISDATVRVLGYQKKEVFADTHSNPSAFEVRLPVDDYTIEAFGENYKEGSKNIEVRGSQDDPFVIKLERIFTDTELTLIKEKNLPRDLKEKDPSRFELLTDDKAPQVIEKDGVLFIDVAPIYFDFDLFNISEDSRAVLDELADKLIKYKRIKMRIQSHTDSRGPAEYNMPLSQRRAKSTFDYLVQKGIDPSRIQYQGFGDTKPVINCPAGQCTEADHQLNRRSEFEITGY